MLLNGKVAVITGASMGIGEAIANLFAREGATVVLSSRDLGRAEAARARIGRPERTMAVACDVRNREEIERLMALTLHNFGRVDIWINNAGYGMIDTIADINMDACRAMFNTNLFGAIDGLQVAAAQMKLQRGGTIINISSVAGHIPVPLGAAYGATKFAMNAMGKASRLELRKYGINVLTVCPGFIETEFHANVVRNDRFKHARSPVRGPGPDRVARAVLRGYLRNKREVVVPWYYQLFMKLYQLWPGLVEYGMLRFRTPSEEPIAATPDSVGKK
ncbi:MAG TPA: SDR family oxidoreductase [Terriglobales bacterium]|nr:SDR family oxidoreductase [Terriglobales bacterium]